MDRRELLKRVALSSGIALSIPLSSSLLTACSTAEESTDTDYKLQFFNEADFNFVRNLLDVLIPATESPSAVEVGVHRIIDTMISIVYGPEEKPFIEEQFKALKEYVAGTNDLQDKLSTLFQSDHEKDKVARDFLVFFKGHAINFYLSTKEIATEYLNYLPVPGDYEPCISLESVNGKRWAI